MADFSAAWRVTSVFEGGYSDDRRDPGGETYRGIARLDHADWQGWSKVDAAKARGLTGGALTAALAEDQDLDALVRQLYREWYWQPLRADDIASQAIASELFDTAVNCGLGVAVRLLQESLNALNRNGSDWPDIGEDGGFGPATARTLQDALDDGLERLLLTAMVGLKVARYIQIMRTNPALERFARGWLARAAESP